MTVLLGALLPLFLPSHLESFSEYDSYLKTNYLLAKLIPIPQQGAIGPTGLESAAVWLMNEHLLDLVINTGTAAVPGFPFVLISYLQLVLGDLNGFIHGIVAWSH